MMAYSEDHIALAAEYALGTLDAEERAQVEAMMSVDKDFTAMVEAWEQKLGALNQMVGAVEPRPLIWENIKAAIGHAGAQEPLILPDAPPPPVAEVAPTAVIADTSNVIQFSRQVRMWRGVARVASSIAAALVAFILVGLFQPDLLPDALRPAPRTQIIQAKAQASAVAASAQYVAVLQKDAGAPAFILTVDGATKTFTIRKVEATPEAGKSFELWLISDRLPKSRSLGVVGASDFNISPALASYDPSIVNGATYAVTVEQAGGSPDGTPHSTPVFAGKLIETVPPPAR
jgi:anti-sigma-K factor RskA